MPWKSKAETLYDRCVALVSKDLRHLEEKAGEGKLSYNAARDLVSYMKLLKDIKAVEEERRAVRAKDKAAKKATLTDEQLEALVTNGPSPQAPINPTAPSNPNKT